MTETCCSSKTLFVSFVQEVSSMLLEKLVAAGIGDRPVVFVTHRYVWCLSTFVRALVVSYSGHFFLLVLSDVAVFNWSSLLPGLLRLHCCAVTNQHSLLCM